MALTFVDFKCDNAGGCGHEWEHSFLAKSDISDAIPCEKCTRLARRLWTWNTHIHATHSSRYGKYEPAFGEFVTSYSHKQELLKKYNVEESSDSVGGSRCYRDLLPDKPALSSALSSEISFVEKPEAAKE